MAVQTVFQRYEMKYLLTQAQREAVLRALEPHMALDPYGRTVIRNLYLDTESYRLIRRSIEKPVYKEKMRIRCYGPAHPDSRQPCLCGAEEEVQEGRLQAPPLPA